MRAVVQRISRGRVVVDDAEHAAIGPGLLVYLGVAPEDESGDVQYIVEKIAALRIFADAAGKMNRSVVDVGGSLLVVPAFTVQADARKGRRPAFDGAAGPDLARRLFETVCDQLSAAGLSIGRGVFGAHMDVDAINDGPICILLDSKRLL